MTGSLMSEGTIGSGVEPRADLSSDFSGSEVLEQFRSWPVEPHKRLVIA